MKKILLISFLTFFVFSCGSSKKVASKKRPTKTRTVTVRKAAKKTSKTRPTTSKETSEKPAEVAIPTSTEAYIAMYQAVAQEEMRLYGIPASITMAQGILESASGQGRLSVEANNHFGIKCHDWTGAKIYHDDDKTQECFRKYNNAKYSFRDHSLFLTGRSRYGKLFHLKKDDYKGWAKELRAAGYATDKKYPAKLISLIERYQLDKLDDAVLGTSSASKPRQTTSNTNTYTVVKGDTLYSISRKFSISVKALQALNNLESTELSIGQTLTVK